MSQSALTQVLRGLSQFEDPNLLVGSATSDDAGVYRINDELALVQTLDFFTPIVDDPYLFGQIAATNSLSDVYAMGGKPLTAMNILGVPIEILGEEAVKGILEGGADKVKESRCALVGGHSIKNPEPIYGLSVTGVVNPYQLITNAGAKPGDIVVLTKPLGTGILSTAIKRNLVTDPALIERGTHLMAKLNTPGWRLAAENLVQCGTDITGFGLTGHLKALCQASGVSVSLDAEKIPVLDPMIFRLIEEEDCVPGGTLENLRNANEVTQWAPGVSRAHRIIFADAQTSGGLLCCVAKAKLNRALEILEEEQAMIAQVIGEITDQKDHFISVS